MFAVLLMLSFIASMLAVPNVNAQSKVVSWPFVDAIPNPAGVGQAVLFNWGLIQPLDTYNDGWNVTLQITYPNGKVENHTGKTWSTGTIGRYLTFAEPGNYTAQCFFDGETYKGRNYAPGESDIITFEIIEGWYKPIHPGHSMPTSYWTRPVDSQLREWYSIMGSWVAIPRNFYAPYNAAPESAHILWNMPIGDTMGGLAGGANLEVGFQNGDAYEGKFAGSIILAGVLYYNKYVSNSPQQAIVAVELRTGKVLWENTYSFGNSRISRGQTLNFVTENNRGAWAYIWLTSGTTMYALDAKNGDLKYNMTNVPGGTIYVGPSGEMLKYAVTNIGTTANPNWRLTQWNSTYVVNRGKTGTADAWGSQIQGRTYDASLGYDVNVSVSGMTTTPGSILVAFPGDRVILAPAISATDGVFLTGISIDSENPGQVLFYRRQTQAPSVWADLTLTTQSRWAAFSDDPYVAIFWTKENRMNYAFSLETGKYMWESEPHRYQDAWTNAGLQGAIVNGKLYEASLAGIVYCYDVETGKELWTYEAKDQYTESYLGENWWLTIPFISDGKVYVGHMEHSTLEPKPRGAPFFCLDAETGDLIWKIDGAFRQTLWGGQAVIGDSIIATMDTYDQQIYAVGKGPSDMTVLAPNIAITAGTTALISGTVMDVSPGTQSDRAQLQFPKGVPVASDESQSEWMLHVYKQFAAPATFTGVEISLYAWDGQSEESELIGKTTTDIYGRYSVAWTPTKAGQYEIYAFFDGSASYYSSEAKAEAYVSAAPEIVEVETPPYELYIIGVGIAIIAVVLIGVVLILKKIGQKQ